MRTDKYSPLVKKGCTLANLEELVELYRLVMKMRNELPSDVDTLKSLLETQALNLETAARAIEEQGKILDNRWRNGILGKEINARLGFLPRATDCTAVVASLRRQILAFRGTLRLIGSLFDFRYFSDAQMLALLCLYCRARHATWPEIHKFLEAEELPTPETVRPELGLKEQDRKYRKRHGATYQSLKQMVETYVRTCPTGEPTLLKSEAWRQWHRSWLEATRAEERMWLERLSRKDKHGRNDGDKQVR